MGSVNKVDSPGSVGSAVGAHGLSWFNGLVGLSRVSGLNRLVLGGLSGPSWLIVVSVLIRIRRYSGLLRVSGLC